MATLCGQDGVRDAGGTRPAKQQKTCRLGGHRQDLCMTFLMNGVWSHGIFGRRY